MPLPLLAQWLVRLTWPGVGHPAHGALCKCLRHWGHDIPSSPCHNVPLSPTSHQRIPLFHPRHSHSVPHSIPHASHSHAHTQRSTYQYDHVWVYSAATLGLSGCGTNLWLLLSDLDEQLTSVSRHAPSWPHMYSCLASSANVSASTLGFVLIIFSDCASVQCRCTGAWELGAAAAWRCQVACSHSLLRGGVRAVACGCSCHPPHSDELRCPCVPTSHLARRQDPSVGVFRLRRVDVTTSFVNASAEWTLWTTPPGGDMAAAGGAEALPAGAGGGRSTTDLPITLYDRWAGRRGACRGGGDC